FIVVPQRLLFGTEEKMRVVLQVHFGQRLESDAQMLGCFGVALQQSERPSETQARFRMFGGTRDRTAKEALCPAELGMRRSDVDRKAHPTACGLDRVLDRRRGKCLALRAAEKRNVRIGGERRG